MKQPFTNKLITGDLFADIACGPAEPELLCADAWLLRQFALADATQLFIALQHVIAQAPLRHMVTPGGLRMSVAMSNCGTYGWVSDHNGYRYETIDPLSDQPWPSMPEVLRQLAETAAARMGFVGFQPDACLINCYRPGTRLSLHQDKNERDFSQPIVSVSLGLPIVFLLGGMQRADKTLRLPLTHGDVVVWGGSARLRYHGVLPLKEGVHPLLGSQRINLTFRKAM